MDAAVSPREAEVLALLGEHLTHAEIASRLVLSVRTVESHAASLRRKLGLPGHRELVRYAATARRGAPRAPEPLTSFVGRSRERAELADAVVTARLVSVVGPGGAGKTRLARAVAADLADRFAGTVLYADLVPVSDGSVLAATVAAACGVADLPGTAVEDSLVRGLTGAPALLVLDNCEHLVNGVALLVERLVTSCADLHVLVTSRARLVLPHERVYPLGGMSLDGDAVALFAERAVAAGWHRPTSEQLARMSAICRALDGLALAIELAAVRLPSLGLDGVERSLDDHATLLTGGPRRAARQRSMHDTLEWSYRLLEPVECAVLSRVAVFAAGFDADAAAAVAGFGGVGDGDVARVLGRLTDQSLLGVVGKGWRMLEPVRQFALAELTDADRGAYASHLSWVRTRAAGLMRTSLAPGRGWHADLDDIVDDLRAAAAWAAHHETRPDEAAELTETLATLLFRAGRAREAQLRYEQAAERSADAVAAAARFAQAAAVAACRVLGEEALRLELAALGAARRGGDQDVLARALARTAELILRFEGMFAGPVPVSTAQDLLAELSGLGTAEPAAATARTAAVIVGISRADPSDPRWLPGATQAADAVHRAGDVLRESAALDILTGGHLVSGRPLDAMAVARRRVELLARRPVEPAEALELKDALHMAVLACVGSGELPAAHRYAELHAGLAFVREQRDLADWTAAGRRAAAGRAIGACAVAMAYGLLDETSERERWLDVVAELRGVDRVDATHGVGYGQVFDALVHLHRADPDAALSVLADEQRGGWYGGLLCQWRIALLAEAATLAADPSAPSRLAAADAGCTGNPVALLLIERARALDDAAGLSALASRFTALGVPYQAHRTALLARRAQRRR